MYAREGLFESFEFVKEGVLNRRILHRIFRQDEDRNTEDG